MPVVAQAQPDINNAPKGDNPANRPARGARVLTPEDRFKRQLVQANVTTVAHQDAVIAYVKGEMEARQKMIQTGQTLQTSLRNKGVTDAQVAGLLNDYNVAATDDKARHKKALDTLKASIDVSQFPRLEAMLTLAGLYGDGPAVSMSGLTALGGRQLLRGRVDAAANANALGGARGNMANRLNRRAGNANNQNVPF